YDANNHEYTMQAAGSDETPAGERILFRGLYQVQLDPLPKAGMPPSTANIEIANCVLGRLLAQRGLCEDFEPPQPLCSEEIAVKATIETDSTKNGPEILAQIYQRLADYIAPPIRFYTLDQMLDSGARVEEIFEGPPLQRGFIKAEELKGAQRRTE